MPTEWEPLAQAALMVKFMPFNLKIVERFMVTEEFIALNIAPEPTKVVSFFSRILSTDSITDLAVLSLPYKIPISRLSRKSWSILAFFRASIVAT